MKGSLLAVAAAVGGVSAAAHRHAHAHGQLFKRGADQASVCVPGCTTIYTTIYGEPTLVPHKPSSKPAVVPSAPATTEAPPKPTSTQKPSVDVPTPVPEVCPTPGTYTFPATTITVSQTTTVCAPETTKVPAGTHTIGGVTTVVESATTVVCPYATEKTSNGVVTSVVETTTYVCPTPGTYTIAPTTTTVTAPTTCVYPVVTTVVPGTYVRPAVVTTITETSVVVVCPFTSQEPVPTTSSSAVVVPAPVPTTSSAVVVPAPVPTTSASASPEPAPVPTTSAKASSSAPAPSPSAPATGGGLGGNNGDHWAITYTPYAEDASGSCKSADQVDSDIATIKKSGFRTVRVYSTDCSTLENVGAACEKYGLKMIIGIFVKESCDPQSADVKSQVDAIAAWKRWDMVELVVIGNECIFQGRCSASSLKQLIVATKATITAAGYSGPYTTAETVGVWQQSDVMSEICDVVDIVGGQIHPYFNAQTSAADAGTFVKSQIELLESSSICGSKPALNLECGWPASGSCNGVACPGTSEQSTAIASIKELAGGKTVFFSFHNDPWKAPGACGCEQSWGCGQLFTSL
ncbi:glycoside hydrolase [Colletotrichum zoysiae]|uniref:Probable beta-glucosidase btgE n=1 Tax=Colletotrichum zoysiae TaxID=1216348 RepID=A0AAD9HC90_9PEZI|nr:glycoside hydrolase [Colletotrichum zoysiae]